MEEKSNKFLTSGYKSIEKTWTKAHMNDCTICYLTTWIFLLLNCLASLDQISSIVTLKLKVTLSACDLIACRHRCGKN